MHHTAIVACLVKGDLAFFVENNEVQSRILAHELQADRETDNSCADYGNIAMSIVHGKLVLSV
jgi:hypothetical protein